MAQQVLGNFVDLALDGFKACGELGNWCGAANQFFPPAAVTAEIKFGDGKPADCCDHVT